MTYSYVRILSYFVLSLITLLIELTGTTQLHPPILLLLLLPKPLASAQSVLQRKASQHDDPKQRHQSPRSPPQFTLVRVESLGRRGTHRGHGRRRRQYHHEAEFHVLAVPERRFQQLVQFVSMSVEYLRYQYLQGVFVHVGYLIHFHPRDRYGYRGGYRRRALLRRYDAEGIAVLDSHRDGDGGKVAEFGEEGFYGGTHGVRLRCVVRRGGREGDGQDAVRRQRGGDHGRE